MIEMEGNRDRNLKNVKQIGTPREENKIYLENMTYNKIKEECYDEKSVFVLMGHTERMGEKYATFIEAAILVSEIGFVGNVPKWNNEAWSEVFREIKRLYEDMIMVGWALDIKGMMPQMTPELERIHREHFGGVHQLLFLLDTLEQEETFYIYKENKLISKDGFYIYHKARCKERTEKAPEKERTYERVSNEKRLRDTQSQAEVALQLSEQGTFHGGRYRQMILEQRKPKKNNGNMGIAVAVAILIFVIGVGVYESGSAHLEGEASVEANAQLDQNSTETENIKEDNTETNANEIEVEVIPGNE